MVSVGQSINAGDFPAALFVSDETNLGSIGTSYVVGSPVVAGTFVAPTSGKILVTLGLYCNDSTNQAVILDYQIYLGTSSAGTLIYDVGNMTRRLELRCSDSGYGAGLSKTSAISGLSGGSTYYIRTQHKAVISSGPVIYARSLIVTPTF